MTDKFGYLDFTSSACFSVADINDYLDLKATIALDSGVKFSDSTILAKAKFEQHLEGCPECHSLLETIEIRQVFEETEHGFDNSFPPNKKAKVITYDVRGYDLHDPVDENNEK